MSMRSDPTAPLRGLHADGRAPVSSPVSVTFGTDGLVLEREGWGHSRVWGYHELASAAPLKSRAADCLVTCARFQGETLFLQGDGIGGRLAAKAPHLSAARARFAGMKPGLAALAIVGVLAAGVVLSGFSPTQSAAKALPEPARDAMGRNVVQALAGRYKTCETPASRAALQRLTTRLAVAARKDPLTVHVRVVDWGLVNAFAVPGGHIVLTRGLLNTAGSSDELAGVLAHELGHALELHPEAGLVRQLGFGAAVQLMFAGSAGTMTNIGLFITEIQYTRSAEHEADAHAVRILRNAGIALKGFADFFKRLEKLEPNSPITDSAVLRTHPVTKERIAFVEAQSTYAATPAMSAEDWEALRAACGPIKVDPRREHLQTVADATRNLEQRPQDDAQWARRARAYSRLDKHREALADWDKVVDLRPKDAQGHIGRGIALDGLRRFDEAVKAYDTALEFSPRNVVVMNRRALDKRELKRLPEALADFDTLLELSPNFAAGHYNRGLVLLDLARPEDAMRAFAGAIAVDKDYTAAYTHRGILHMEAGKSDAAVAEFRAALASKGQQESAGWGTREARANLRKLGTQ